MFDSNLLNMPGMRGVLASLAVLSLLQAAAIALQAFLLSIAIAALWEGAPLDGQLICIAGFFACYAACQLAAFAQDSLLDRYSLNRAKALRSELLESVFDSQSLLASRYGSGRIATGATESVDEIQNYIRVIPPRIVGMVAISLPLLVFAFVLDWVSGVILAIMLPVIVFFMILLGRQAGARAARQYMAYTRLSNRFMDTVRGLSVLRSFGTDAREGSSVHDFSERLRRATMRTLATAMLSSAVLDLCATFGVAAVAMMLAFRLMDGSMALPAALTSLMIAPEYFKPIRAFASEFHASHDGRNALADVVSLTGAESTPRNESESAGETVAWDETSVLSLRSIGYGYEDCEDALSSVDIDARGFERIAIVGKSGSGKSTLADIIAGFRQARSGHFELDGKTIDLCSDAWKRIVRYIPQKPYLFRASLRDNLRFYAPGSSDEAVLAAVRAVGLESLVEELPEGLDTIIGEGARGLSGGQAHRIALARILLDESARVLVFDEPTAHLDIETEADLKPQMLTVMQGKLVFFATHRLHWTQDMDCVVVLEDGHVKEVKAGGRDPEKPSRLRMSYDLPANPRSTPRSMQIERPSLSPDTDTALRRLKRPPWLQVLVARYKRSVAVALAFGMAALACAALLMFTSGYLISATAIPGMTLFAIMVPVAFVQIFGLGRPFARYVERLVSHDWVLKITSDLRSHLYEGIRIRIDDPECSQATGEYLGLLADDIGHLQNLYLRVAFPIATALLLAIGACLVYARFDALFTIPMLAIFALAAVLIPFLAYRLAKPSTTAAKRARSREYARLTDNVLGASDWILAGRAHEAVASHERDDAVLRTHDAASRKAERISELATQLVLGLTACLVVCWAAMRFGNGPDPNWIAAFALGFFPLIESFASLPHAFASASNHVDAVARLDEYVNDNSPSDETPSEAYSQECSDEAAALQFESLCSTYPSGTSRALDAISLDIAQGQSVAILGRSGSGKSTFADVARGILEPDSGKLFVMGREAKRGKHDFPASIAYLGQEPYLFNRSLRENLVLGRKGIVDGRIVESLEAVGLGQKLSSLSHGLDTVIGETGTGLSGGEAHRVALARTLLSDAPVVLVDEPFSALDPETEHDLLDALLDICDDRTLVVITHHLAEIERFDRVVFIEDGRVTLDGAPEDLAHTNAYFRNLIEFDRNGASDE